MDTRTGYYPIADYGFIGDMHTCALVSKNGYLDFMCWPAFDSPSVFCRLLDKDKGGYFLICLDRKDEAASKQNYLPYTNMLNTKWFHLNGAAEVLDYFPVTSTPPSKDNQWLSGWCPCRDPDKNQPYVPKCHSGLIRKVACTTGQVDMVVELFPAFNYARDKHTTLCDHEKCTMGPGLHTITFKSETQQLLVEIHVDSKDEKGYGFPAVDLELQDKPSLNGRGLYAKLRMSMEQSVTFVIHTHDTTIPDTDIGPYIGRLEQETFDFWTSWARRCTFSGHYREQVVRSMLVLKLLTYKPTGAIIAAPTFSLPEAIGGTRNWDYRYSWLRDTSFTLYVFLKNGYSEEAESFMSFVYDRVIPSISCRAVDLGKEQIMPIVISIRGEHQLPEIELPHLEGYRGSRPVRVGNGATSHTQLDTLGALLDSIYLYNKFARPISYDRWVEVRRIVNHIIELRNTPDMSIWEVRGQKQNFVFSKIMIWVMIDRALRLSDKRSNLPCPDYFRWRSIRDELYDEIMLKGYNSEKGFFGMSYERPDVLDASVLIAPLVLFIAPDDPRILSTIREIRKPKSEGGLTSSKMVFRYDHTKVQDGMPSPDFSPLERIRGVLE